MKRKRFIQLGSTLAATSFLTPLSSMAFTTEPQERLKNWAGNLTYGTSNVRYPKSMTEIQQTLKFEPKLRVLGTRHCFNTIADSKDNLVCSRDFNQVVSID